MVQTARWAVLIDLVSALLAAGWKSALSSRYFGSNRAHSCRLGSFKLYLESEATIAVAMRAHNLMNKKAQADWSNLLGLWTIWLQNHLMCGLRNGLA